MGHRERGHHTEHEDGGGHGDDVRDAEQEEGGAGERDAHAERARMGPTNDLLLVERDVGRCHGLPGSSRHDDTAAGDPGAARRHAAVPYAAAIAVLAHSVGGAGLPFDRWLFVYGAVLALLLTFFALRMVWLRPRFASGATRPFPSPRGGRAGGAVHVVTRAIGLFGFAVVLVAALWGSVDPGSNVTPTALHVFWVGFIVVCSLIGDVYPAVNPFDTLAWLLRVPRSTGRGAPGRWTAAVLLSSYLWYELAYHDPLSPRRIGAWLATYTVVTMAGAVWWGRDWLRDGEGFAALFGLLGLLAPLGRDRTTGRLRLRAPLTGLSSVDRSNGSLAVLVVVLGAVAFDAFTGTTFWGDVIGARSGWSLTFVDTIGLVWLVAVAAGVYLAAVNVLARLTDGDPRVLAGTFSAVLVPITFGYAVAHYFGLLVYDSQNLYALVSDPFGRGWDLFGTIDHTVDYSVISAQTIALVQGAVIVAGHVGSGIAAHDRALELFRPRTAMAARIPLFVALAVSGAAAMELLLGA